MKKGFTLAEILITIAIIGVVAAITIPSVIIDSQKEQSAARLKKAYNTLNSVYQMSRFYNGSHYVSYSGTDPGIAYFNQYWKPYLKNARVCTSYTDCGYTRQNPWKKMNSKNPNDFDNFSVYNGSSAGVTFITDDGILYEIRIQAGEKLSADSTVVIDTNGAKGPNVYGKDVFWFTRTNGESAFIKPYLEGKKTVDEDCSKSGTGRSCAYKIMSSGWKMPSGYPW